MVSVNQLSVEFGGFTLFKDVSFLVNPKDKIGLAGKNGAGKSTLLKILAGVQTPTSGTLSCAKDVKIGYLPQHMKHDDTGTVWDEVEKAFGELKTLEKEIDYLNEQLGKRTDYESQSYLDLIHQVSDKSERLNMLGGANYASGIEVTLKGLGFERDDFTRLTSEFSGGWRMRIQLAKILLQKPDVFLLDEPTNHLDIESIQWFEEFLKNYSGAVVLVSHDRAFLDNITKRTIEIQMGKIYDYKASYTRYLELREERKEQQMAAYRNQQKLIEDTEKFIERFRYQATKAVQVQSRIKQLEKLDRIEVDEFDKSALRIKFPPAPHAGSITLEGKHVSKSYGEHEVLSDVDFTIERGEKVAFIGRNGEGKTTMARMIMNEISFTGSIKLGHQVKIGYFAQNQADLLDESVSVLETIDRVAVGDVRLKIRDLLGAFMFSGEAVDKKVSVLSGGERTRLAMVKLLLEPVNLLILDEPTNHLDIRSKELLKQAVKDFEGTVVVVSHDREFLDGLVDKVYEFRHKKMKEHLGGIYEFLERKKMESLKEMELQKPNGKAVKAKDNGGENQGAKLSYEQRKEISRRVKKAQQQVEKCEKKIAQLEENIVELDRLMQIPQNASDPEFVRKYQELNVLLEKEMEQWETCQQELDEAELEKRKLD
ncbi:ABC-F family ATP-binding cassette domain-containing protein [Saccharicrinis fermentans]|uniref:Probable ATP-binding protein YbiT n=1 Tax=Saccharicrinis fermentans DSM 9555 = JCM 21142 TaxID=869213 RepID=W7YLE4_9BACT|nr:ABC-F family ATP-binding cassette domain-containing protein [Saccharicrinis fermentans]GAF03184.1 putative ABC transporter ATP-binding protein YheS [Saccharicrinis fermentans DSM 9555 = JCM 21142]